MLVSRPETSLPPPEEWCLLVHLQLVIEDVNSYSAAPLEPVHRHLSEISILCTREMSVNIHKCS